MMHIFSIILPPNVRDLNLSPWIAIHRREAWDIANRKVILPVQPKYFIHTVHSGPNCIICNIFAYLFNGCRGIIWIKFKRGH